MDVLFTAEFWTALMSIVIIDLVLAGDNAIVIGLAARNLPKQDQTKVIIWGTIGAVIIRIAATMGVVYLLKIPGLLIVGGLLLIWIAIKLLVEEKEHDVKSGTSMWAAIRTIIIADAAMGLDNVLAVAGAAHGSMMLVVLGLTISVPIVVWGSTVVLKLIERFPWIIMIGSAVLGWTAAKMFVGEAFLKDFFVNPVIKYGFEAVVIAFVLVVGMIVKKKRVQEKASVSAASSEGPRHAQGE
ncbi:TerC family protein [Paenibacillus sp. ACRRX]|uniref:TerC family protein n=1 Tax=Paenibacillus sp. ACRRX TaxID=2918206 RepID=UPI001EF4F263|nr:TerC family protein [Paenibacillus sp. ACRRX]MCG7406228.1 TerC family protein [Paenibacillus sp. ACRRX]